MNFGDILSEWERGQTGASRKSDMEIWLQKNDVYDKDANVKSRAAPGENRKRLLNSQPDDVLDIHGLTGEKAWFSLDEFFTKAKDCGYEKLRIIHGKGNHSQGEAVLGRTVLKFIEQCAFAGESGFEKSINGGAGATWVLLKIRN
jgi:DNA-nicking Smr family endonuclease